MTTLDLLAELVDMTLADAETLEGTKAGKEFFAALACLREANEHFLRAARLVPKALESINAVRDDGGLPPIAGFRQL